MYLAAITKSKWVVLIMFEQVRISVAYIQIDIGVIKILDFFALEFIARVTSCNKRTSPQ